MSLHSAAREQTPEPSSSRIRSVPILPNRRIIGARDRALSSPIFLDYLLRFGNPERGSFVRVSLLPIWSTNLKKGGLLG